MSNELEVKQGQGFYWDSRGKVTATWVERDLVKLKRWLSRAEPEQKIADLKQRIADQFVAYLAKVTDGRVLRHKTLAHFGRLTAEFDQIVGTDFGVKLATAAAAKLASSAPLPWDVRGRVVPQWMKRAAALVKREHERLAKAERALASVTPTRIYEQQVLRKRVAYRREMVKVVEDRLAAMTEHGAAQTANKGRHMGDATVATIKHLYSSVEDVKATSALAAGSSFSSERYTMLEKKLKSALLSLPAKKGFLRERDDAIQQGRLGIQKAAEKWDVGHPLRSKFTSYAPLWIGRFMECRTDDGVAADKRRKGSWKKSSLDVHEDDERSDFKHPAASDDTARTAIVRMMLEQLTPIERTVVERAVMRSEKVVDVAESMGLTRDMVRKIRDEALTRLAL